MSESSGDQIKKIDLFSYLAFQFATTVCKSVASIYAHTLKYGEKLYFLFPEKAYFCH